MPVFGAGSDLPARTWQSVYRQLLASGLVSVDHAAFGALKLVPEARAVFKHERKVFFRKDRPTSARAAKSAKTPAARERAALGGEEAVLFEALRKCAPRSPGRRTYRPMWSFPDTTLIGLAKRGPHSLDAMLEISGSARASWSATARPFWT